MEETSGSNGVAPVAAKPAKVSEHDKLRVDNAFLELQNLNLQRELLTKDLGKCVEQMQAKRQRLLALRDELSNKYDVDIETEANRILPDGTILPRGAVPLMPPKT